MDNFSYVFGLPDHHHASITINMEPDMAASHIPVQLVPKLQSESNRLTHHSLGFYARSKDS